MAFSVHAVLLHLAVCVMIFFVVVILVDDHGCHVLCSTMTVSWGFRTRELILGQPCAGTLGFSALVFSSQHGVALNCTSAGTPRYGGDQAQSRKLKVRHSWATELVLTGIAILLDQAVLESAAPRALCSDSGGMGRSLVEARLLRALLAAAQKAARAPEPGPRETGS